MVTSVRLVLVVEVPVETVIVGKGGGEGRKVEVGAEGTGRGGGIGGGVRTDCGTGGGRGGGEVLEGVVVVVVKKAVMGI